MSGKNRTKNVVQDETDPSTSGSGNITGALGIDLLDTSAPLSLPGSEVESSGPARAKTSAAPDLTFLVIGDSYSTSFSPLFNAIDAQLDSSGLDVKLISKARGGAALADGVKQFNAGFKSGVDGVIVLLGSNDGLEANPIAAAERSLDKLLTRIDSKGVPALVAGTYGEWPDQNAGYATAAEVERFEAIFGRQADKHNDIFFERLLDGAYGIEGRTEDGEHPNDEGAQVIAARMADVLDQLIARAQ